MPRSNDPGHFFQTSSSLETSQRKTAKSQNKQGNPIRLPSKILVIIPDPTPGSESCVFVAESAGTARRVDIGDDVRPIDHAQKTAQAPRKPTRQVYRGPTAPVTSLAISSDTKTLFAGCWDKCIWSWDIDTAQPKRKYAGHSDFVKSVLCATLRYTGSTSGNSVADGNTVQDHETNTLDLLISGSADASIIVWSIASGQKLHTIRGGERAMGVLDLAIDPSTLLSAPLHLSTASHSESQHYAEQFTLYAGSSDPLIRRWHVSASAAGLLKVTEAGPGIATHETSVNKLLFANVPNDEQDYDDRNAATTTHDLFTASADNTAKRLARRAHKLQSTDDDDSATAAPAFIEAASFAHPDFVRAVVVAVPTSPSPHGPLVVTACRDEEVRVFDLDTADLLCVFGGHFEEVTGLALLVVRGRQVLVSVGIDGTVRRWGLEGADIAGAAALQAERAAGGGELREEEEEGQDKGKGSATVMTAEEEAELAELMDDDDD